MQKLKCLYYVEGRNKGRERGKEEIKELNMYRKKSFLKNDIRK